MINKPFKLVSNYSPTGDQPAAIEKLAKGLISGEENQILLGVTGSGKTYTIANVIEKVQKPTLVISHNKTLAAQLYQEFKAYFPDNAVSYFVSYYDYYQPESYIPQTDTYIEKETEINEEVDKLRLATTTNLMTRSDVIVVSSVSCIYNLGNPIEYIRNILTLSRGLSRQDVLTRLVGLQYQRSDFDFKRGTFRVKGENIDIYPSYDNFGIRLQAIGNNTEEIHLFDPLTGVMGNRLDTYTVYPAKHYMTDTKSYGDVFDNIMADKKLEVEALKKAGKEFEAHRLNQRVNYDLEMIKELGYVNGIENYSRYFERRPKGDPPYSLLSYFLHNRKPSDYLTVVDESHITIPQIRGMYNGDASRKQTLIDFGFRLRAALDNRPLKFHEFLNRKGQTIYVSATPEEWELSISGKDNIAQQLIRPTGIIDPPVEIRPTANQVPDLMKEIQRTVRSKGRVLVTVITKRLSEELAEYVESVDNNDIKPTFLHSDIETFERSRILRKLRLGEFNVIVGVNLLREGLDLPEVTLIAILDADKEGFLRSKTSLIQIMGRAARNSGSRVIMYADRKTTAIKESLLEISRRRKIQLNWNKIHHLEPKTIIKPIMDEIVAADRDNENTDDNITNTLDPRLKIEPDELTPEQARGLVAELTGKMRYCAKILDYESAALYRDRIELLKNDHK